jgi:hypothetical protein
VDSTLRLDGATSNAPVAVALHSAYEGAFSLRSSLFTPTLKERDVEDPSGRGRPRDVEIRRMGRGYIEGRVRYDPPGVAGGWVELKTSNARAGLTL